jgi:hypothetical protein
MHIGRMHVHPADALLLTAVDRLIDSNCGNTVVAGPIASRKGVNDNQVYACYWQALPF